MVCMVDTSDRNTEPGAGFQAADTAIPLADLLRQVRACRVCAAHLPLGPRPVLRASATARILVVGQAPGLAVHRSGVPWDDPSGVRLRDWMGVDEATFRDERHIAIMPIGFCYPGRGRGGDLPPRPECAPLWFPPLLAHMPGIRLTLLIGQYAQRHVLGKRCKPTLTQTVQSWRDYAPRYWPLPHPSPRNTPWRQRQPWFERDEIPHLRARVAEVLARPD